MDIKRLLHKYWDGIDSLDDKIYYSVNAIGLAALALAFIMGLAQHLAPIATIATLLCSLWMFVLLIVGIRRPKSLPVCRLILVCGLNFVLLPPAYFACGGLTSGMVLFYLVSLFLTAVLLRGRARIIVFASSLLFLAYSLHFGYYHPDWIISLSPRQEYEDVIMTFCTTGLALGAMTIFILNAYDNERKRNEILVSQLSSLSVHDALSGLYNRRELFRRLDLLYQPPVERKNVIKRDGCYIVMFDIDDFKLLNDTYGHQFGDEVLSTVASKLGEAVVPDNGELAARYGGEEFVCIFYSRSINDAFRRADEARAAIEHLRWKKQPSLTVTISGGIVSCEHYAELDVAMHDVDKLLYAAKHSGKNRIVMQDNAAVTDASASDGASAHADTGASDLVSR